MAEQQVVEPPEPEVVQEEPVQGEASPEPETLAEGETKAGDAPVKPVAPAGTPEWVQRRFDELTRDKYEANRVSDELRGRLKELSETLLKMQTGDGEQRFTKSEVDQMVKDQAAKLAGEAQQRAGEADFNAQCNVEATKGKEVYSDWDQTLANFNMLGGLSRPFLEAALETGKAHEVIYALGKDMNKTSELFALSPLKQAVAITKFAAELAAKPTGKSVSSAPSPITPKVGGKNSGPNPSLDDENLSMADFIKLREEQTKGRRR